MDAAWIFQYHARGHMWTGGESAQNSVILLDLAPAVGRSKMVYVHRQFKKTLCSLSLLAAASHPNLSSKYGYSGSRTQSQAVGKISNETVLKRRNLVNEVFIVGVICGTLHLWHEYSK